MPTLVRAKPSAVPPIPPPLDVNGGGGDGGERFRVPGWLLALAVGMAIGCVYAAYRFALVVPLRPLPILLALVCAVSAAWHVGGPFEATADRFYLWVVSSAIGGGVVGEVTHYAIVGMPASAPRGILWILLGGSGIGGGIGVAVGLYVGLGWLAGGFAVFVWQMWRRRTA